MACKACKKRKALEYKIRYIFNELDWAKNEKLTTLPAIVLERLHREVKDMIREMDLEAITE
jgi:hypothetical protein